MTYRSAQSRDNDLGFASESAKGRFAFGENWRRFLAIVDEQRVARAEQSLREMLKRSDLAGLTFLDVGSGSGLFSLAARRLGARVHSFDLDTESVSCTKELRRRFLGDDPNWVIGQGSILDDEYVRTLGQSDIVYSWGVLHHTGAMWRALGNVATLVRKGGLLVVAIYNDQGYRSTVWRSVKKSYNRLPRGLRWIILWPAFMRLWGPTLLRDTLRASPLRTWRTYHALNPRGMSPWRDVVDWVGGLPFEVARPEEIFDFYHSRGFELIRLTTCGGGLGCNQYVFRLD